MEYKTNLAVFTSTHLAWEVVSVVEWVVEWVAECHQDKIPTESTIIRTAKVNKEVLDQAEVERVRNQNKHCLESGLQLEAVELEC